MRGSFSLQHKAVTHNARFRHAAVWATATRGEAPRLSGLSVKRRSGSDWHYKLRFARTARSKVPFGSAVQGAGPRPDQPRSFEEALSFSEPDVRLWCEST